MMKRSIITVIAAVMLLSTACGKKEETESVIGSAENESVELTDQENEESEEAETKEEKSDALAGVYLNGGELVDVPMGIYFVGEQKNFCNIKMPTDYLFGAIYTEDGINEKSNQDISEYDLNLAIEKGIYDQPYASKWVHLLSTKEDATEMFFNIETSETMTLDGMKEYAPNYVELGTEELPALYYEDESEYASVDINVCCAINEDILLTISYKGPLAEELSLEQLAQNIYDLIDVIE